MAVTVGRMHGKALRRDTLVPCANFHGLTVDPYNPGGVLVGTDSGEVWQVSENAAWEAMASDLPPVLSIAAA